MRTKLSCIFWTASNKYCARVQERNVFGSCPGQHSLAAPINDLLCSWHQEHQAASTPKEEKSTKLQAVFMLCPTPQLCLWLTEHNCFGQLHNGADANKSTKQFCPTTQQSRAQLLWLTAYLHNCAHATKRVCCITAVKKSWPNILRASANQARSTAILFLSICKISLSYN